MTRLTTIEGIAAPLPIDNLDTDQIMPKQFLRIIDKAGLARGPAVRPAFRRARRATRGLRAEPDALMRTRAS